MRTPEQGHTKRCMANAMISAIENARDAEGFSDFDFASSRAAFAIFAAWYGVKGEGTVWGVVWTATSWVLVVITTPFVAHWLLFLADNYIIPINHISLKGP